MSGSISTAQLIKRILRDIRVEMADEFDRNFERQAYFNTKWQRKRSPASKSSTLLVDTGALRRSVQSRVTDHSVIFESTLPYAAIHNEGGQIVVTQKMKSYFWHRYYQTKGGLGRTKNDTLRKDKRNATLSTQAEFWKHLALMRVGSTIKIPKRQFLGTGAEVEQLVREVVEESLSNYFDHDFELNIKGR